MRTSTIIHDPETLRSLTPGEIERYLREHGWAQKRPWQRGDDLIATVWRKGNSDSVIVAQHQEYSDYALRVSEILREVALREGHNNQRRVYYAMKGLHNAADIVITFNDSAKLTINIAAEWDAEINEEGHEMFHEMMHILRAAIEQIKQKGG